MDYSKAFDSVPHRRLLQKLARYGIRGRLLEWISDFQKGRKQRICVRGKTSEWSDVRSGVPQGSVLGPLCFLLYVADIDAKVESVVQINADYTKIYRRIQEATRGLEKVARLVRCFGFSGLTLINVKLCI